MLVEKSCLQIPLLGLRTYSEQRPGETSAKALPAILFLVSLNAHTTIFDILHKQSQRFAQTKPTSEKPMKTMFQHEQDNQANYQTSYSLIDCN
jgi:hypothetical protein